MSSTANRHRLAVIAGSLLTAALLTGCGAATEFPATDTALTPSAVSPVPSSDPAPWDSADTTPDGGVAAPPASQDSAPPATLAQPAAPRTAAPHVVIRHPAATHAATPHAAPQAAAAKPAAAPATHDPASCPAADYRNSSGHCVPRPVHAASPPQGATAQCHDGTYSFSQHRRGTCSGHGGVSRWL